MYSVEVVIEHKRCIPQELSREILDLIGQGKGFRIISKADPIFVKPTCLRSINIDGGIYRIVFRGASIDEREISPNAHKIDISAYRGVKVKIIYEPKKQELERFKGKLVLTQGGRNKDNR